MTATRRRAATNGHGAGIPETVPVEGVAAPSDPGPGVLGQLTPAEVLTLNARLALASRLRSGEALDPASTKAAAQELADSLADFQAVAFAKRGLAGARVVAIDGRGQILGFSAAPAEPEAVD